MTKRENEEGGGGRVYLEFGRESDSIKRWGLRGGSVGRNICAGDELINHERYLFW